MGLGGGPSSSIGGGVGEICIFSSFYTTIVCGGGGIGASTSTSTSSSSTGVVVVVQR